MPTGVRRKTPPGFASSTIHSAPSGATSTSRTLWPTSQRSTALRSSLAVERDADDRLRRQAAGKSRAIPLREHRAFVEHEVARRDDRGPSR